MKMIVALLKRQAKDRIKGENENLPQQQLPRFSIW